MLINYGKKFKKQYEKASRKIKVTFIQRRKLFSQNSTDPILNNHSLTGNYLGKRSINITGDWRAVYSEKEDEKGERIVTFHLLGTHSQLYR